MACCRQFFAVFALLLAGLVLSVTASTPSYAQSLSSGGIAAQGQSQSCQIVASNVSQRLEEIKTMIADIKACHDDNMLYDGTGCVPPALNDHSWAQTQVTFYDQANAASAIYDLKGPTGPQGPNSECPSDGCVCPNGDCTQASCYDGGGSGNGRGADHCCPNNTTWVPEAGGWGSACRDRFGQIMWYDCE